MLARCTQEARPPRKEGVTSAEAGRRRGGIAAARLCHPSVSNMGREDLPTRRENAHRAGVMGRGEGAHAWRRRRRTPRSLHQLGCRRRTDHFQPGGTCRRPRACEEIRGANGARRTTHATRRTPHNAHPTTHTPQRTPHNANPTTQTPQRKPKDAHWKATPTRGRAAAMGSNSAQQTTASTMALPATRICHNSQQSPDVPRGELGESGESGRGQLWIRRPLARGAGSYPGRRWAEGAVGCSAVSNSFTRRVHAERESHCRGGSRFSVPRRGTPLGQSLPSHAVRLEGSARPTRTRPCVASRNVPRHRGATRR